MATVNHFEELEAWKLSRELCKKIGVLIKEGRFEKNYRFVHQVEGSSGSIMDNIAEGFERGMRKEFIQFLGFSKGSCGELRSQLYRALDKNYITEIEFDELCGYCKRISAMLQKLIAYLQKTEIKGERAKQP